MKRLRVNLPLGAMIFPKSNIIIPHHIIYADSDGGPIEMRGKRPGWAYDEAKLELSEVRVKEAQWKPSRGPSRPVQHRTGDTISTPGRTTLQRSDSREARIKDGPGQLQKNHPVPERHGADRIYHSRETAEQVPEVQVDTGGESGDHAAKFNDPEGVVQRGGGGE